MAGCLAPHRGTGHTGQQFQHRGPRRAQRPSPAGGAAHWGPWLLPSQSRGPGERPGVLRDSRWHRLLPSRSLRLPPRPRSRPRGSPPGVLRAGAVSWLRAEQRGRAASSHWRCSGHRHPRCGEQAAPAAAARARSPGPPRSFPPPLLLPGTGTSRARAGVETPGPCARDWEEGRGDSHVGQGRPKVPARTGLAPPPPPHPWVSPASRPRSPSGTQALSPALASPCSRAPPAPPKAWRAKLS